MSTPNAEGALHRAIQPALATEASVKQAPSSRGDRFALEVVYPTKFYLAGGPFGADAFFAAVASGSRGKDPWRLVHSSGASRKGRDLAMRFPSRAEAGRAAIRVLDLGLRGVRATVVVYPANGRNEGIRYRYPILPRSRHR